MSLLLPGLQRRLTHSSPLLFVLVTGAVAFAAYGSVYALRKPFTAAAFDGMQLWGVQYKIALVIAQVAGYALSKFLGIRIISGLKTGQRAWALLLLSAVALLALLGFALSPPSWGIFWLFINGIPLGMAWGVVFSYLEGRRVTELLAAILCINFILSSGFVKTVGKLLILDYGVSEFWMPFLAGLLFLPILLLCVWVLEHLPPPSAADQLARSERRPMNQADRKILFRRYAPGLVLLVGVYLLLTIVRDVRDNFAIEIWAELGMGDKASVLTTAEIPIALAVLAVIGALALLKDNFKALWTYHAIFIGSALLIMAATFLFQQDMLSPMLWMVLSGTGAILPYILFNGVIFDRLLAAFKEAGNVGFLMYIADAIGYLGSVAVMLWRNFGNADMSWLQFFGQLCWWGAGMVLVLSLLSWAWFARRAIRVKSA
jgi:hypothetical protein